MKSEFKSQWNALRSVRLNSVKLSRWSQAWSHFSDSAVRECTRFHQAPRSAFPALWSKFEMRLHVNDRVGPKAASSLCFQRWKWNFRLRWPWICCFFEYRSSDFQTETFTPRCDWNTQYRAIHSRTPSAITLAYYVKPVLHPDLNSPQIALLPPP